MEDPPGAGRRLIIPQRVRKGIFQNVKSCLEMDIMSSTRGVRKKVGPKRSLEGKGAVPRARE